MIPIRYNRMGVDYHNKTKWEINHGAGVLDIEITGAGGLVWAFPDGSTSTSTRPIKTVTTGKTIIRCNDFSLNGIQINIRSSSTAIGVKGIPLLELPDLRNILTVSVANCLYGNIAYFPKISNQIIFTRVQHEIWGNIKDFPRVINSIQLYETSNIIGNAYDVPRVSNYLFLSGMPLLSGNITDLPQISNFLFLDSLPEIYGDIGYFVGNYGEKYISTMPNIAGDMNILSTNNPVGFYNNSSVSASEYDQTIANCVSAGGLNKTLYISSRRTSASDADKATLISRGWTVDDSQI